MKRLNKNMYTQKMNIIVTFLIIKKIHTSSLQYSNLHTNLSKELDITQYSTPNLGIQKYEKSAFAFLEKDNLFYNKDNADRLKESITILRNCNNATEHNTYQNEPHHMQRDQTLMNLYGKKAKITIKTNVNPFYTSNVKFSNAYFLAIGNIEKVNKKFFDSSKPNQNTPNTIQNKNLQYQNRLHHQQYKLGIIRQDTKQTIQNQSIKALVSYRALANPYVNHYKKDSSYHHIRNVDCYNQNYLKSFPTHTYIPNDVNNKKNRLVATNMNHKDLKTNVSIPEKKERYLDLHVQNQKTSNYNRFAYKRYSPPKTRHFHMLQKQ